MRKVFFVLLLLLALCVTGARAQDAIVVSDETNIEIADDQRGYTMTCHESFLINTERAADLARFVGHFDREHKLGDFTATITCGSFTKKIKKSDLKRTEYSSAMVMDGYTLYSDFTIPTYPALVTFDYEISDNDEMVSLPRFCPVTDYDISVAHSEWTMRCPKDFTYHYTVLGKGINKSIANGSDGFTTVKFTADSLKSISQEPLSRSLTERVPMAIVVPDTLIYYGTSGSQRTWKELGAWHNSISQGRDLLPDDAKALIHSAADTCKTTLGKIIALKKLMDSRTHYVSIQLGIGGYQPISAEQTWRMGYGDCKGLSNLMKAMLGVVGIDSRLVAINHGSRFFIDSLPSMIYMNHMILEVPTKEGTYWLECTSDKVPVGYTHEDIAGHHALSFGDDGGKLVVLPEYSDSVNRNIIALDVKVNGDGTAHVNIDDKAYCRFYEHEVPVLTYDHDKLVKVANASYNLAQSTINNVSVQDCSVPGQVPMLTLNVDANCRMGRMAGKRMFVTLDPTGGVSTPTINDDRTEDFVIRGGRRIEKQITIHLPEGYSIEAMPKDESLDIPFGSLSFAISCDGSDIKVNKVFWLRNGTFPKSDIEKIKKFFRQTKLQENLKLVLVKN